MLKHFTVWISTFQSGMVWEIKIELNKSVLSKIKYNQYSYIQFNTCFVSIKSYQFWVPNMQTDKLTAFWVGQSVTISHKLRESVVIFTVLYQRIYLHNTDFLIYFICTKDNGQL